MHAQEYHTSFWGHLGLLHLSDHLLTPDFSAYQHTALASPYPHNGVVADLAHAQGALVGYVHPFDWDIDPPKEKSLSQPASRRCRARQGGLHRGRRFLRPQGDRQGLVPPAQPRLPHSRRRGHRRDGQLRVAARARRHEPGVPRHRRRHHARRRCEPRSRRAGPSPATARCSGWNWTASGPEIRVSRAAPGKLRYRIALRSPVAVDHLELVQNGKVVKAFRLHGRSPHARCGRRVAGRRRRLAAAARLERRRRPAGARHLSLRHDQPDLSRTARRRSAGVARTPPISPHGWSA